MNCADKHPLTMGQTPRFGLRVASIARHLALHGFRLRSTGTGWRIEPHHTPTEKARNGERA